MILKNLLRRRGRTLLTILGISIGVAAIVGLGAMAQGLEEGYNSMLSGSQADLVLSQPDSYDISLSSVDEKVGETLQNMPEIEAISGMLEGYAESDGVPFMFVFGYPEDSFVLERFHLIQGTSIFEHGTQRASGKQLMLGASSAETMKKTIGDSVRIGSSVYRVAGIYETGDAFEDAGAVLELEEAQNNLGKPRQVSLFYVKLKSPELGERVMARAERLWRNLEMSSTSDYADKQLLADTMYGFAWAIAGLAILIGGVGMMNSQLMSVYERTREIGVLRAIGWSSGRILRMIFGEALIVCVAGGFLGIGLGYLALSAFSGVVSAFGATATLDPALILRSFLVVFLLGLVAGLYPAYRATRLQPVEALRYEGGSGGRVHRLPVGGMAVQNLVQRTARTFLTLGVIGLTVGTVVAIQVVVAGAAESISQIATGAEMDVVLRQRDLADTSMSAIDERIGSKLATLPGVQKVSGLLMNFSTIPGGSSFFIVQGYGPNDFAIQHFRIIEGERLRSNHQMLLGKSMADALKKGVGDTIQVSGARFKVVGIYVTGGGWEEMGGVVTLRDAQALGGRPRKVSFFGLKLENPNQGSQVVDQINATFPEVHAALTGEFVEQLPDMQRSDGIFNGISSLAILVGGVGVLNTMLMSVHERTREIGVLRALGWRRRGILWLILKEAVLLGLLGGLLGAGLSYGLIYVLMEMPVIGSMLTSEFSWQAFARALMVALILGIIGGLYPAYRATRLQPVEALRYE